MKMISKCIYLSTFLVFVEWYGTRKPRLGVCVENNLSVSGFVKNKGKKMRKTFCTVSLVSRG